MTLEIKCEVCGVIVGSVVLPDDADDARKTSATSDYVCAACAKPADLPIE